MGAFCAVRTNWSSSYGRELLCLLNCAKTLDWTSDRSRESFYGRRSLLLLHVTDDGNMQLIELLLFVPTKRRGILWGPLAGYIIRSRK